MPCFRLPCRALGAAVAVAGGTLPAAALDYQTWARASSAFKGGYVLSLAEYYGTIAQAPKSHAFETAQAYRECFSGTDSDWLARQVEAYVTRNPAVSEKEMIFIVHAAFRDLCKGILDKVPPS